MSQQLYGTSGLATRETLKMTRQALGDLGEITVAQHFQKMGLMVERLAGDFLGDMLIGTAAFRECKIEVKTAFRNQRGTFKFCMYRKSKNVVKTDCSYSDFVVMLCVENDYNITALLVPSPLITTNYVEFKKAATSKFASYRIGLKQ